MRVLLDPSDELIAERQRLGLDIRDEVWGGRYHMVPPASWSHQLLGSRLHLLLAPAAAARGLLCVYETGLYDPSVEPAPYCVPDLAVLRPGSASERGLEGRAELVVEIRSPGDETLEKLPFYERVGVQEVLVVDRHTRALRHWTRQDEHLVETDEAIVTLRALDARLWTADTTLTVEAAGTTSRI